MATAITALRIHSHKVRNGIIVRQVDHMHVKNLFGSIAVGGILLLAILFYVWQRNEVIRFGYEAKQLRAQYEAQLEERRRLLLQRASLESLDRVDRIARSKLDLVTPEESRIFLLERDSSGTSILSHADRAPESVLGKRP